MEENISIINGKEIKNLIYTIRGKQVMLDSDVAYLYNYSTKRINEAVKRNRERFPQNFCFRLTEKELEDNWSQIATGIQKNNYKNRSKKYLPYVFTEQGIAMLSGLLKNEIAVKVSINIMNAFIEMRKYISTNSQVFERLTNVEFKLLEHDKKFDELFDKFQEKEIKQKIFFKGQIWDSYSLIIDIIKRANNKITLIDNYVDDSILDMLIKKKKDVEAVILTSEKSNISKLDIQKFNKEYPILKLAKTNKIHDRFIIIDNKELYHCGASIKDLGKKCFGINKIEDKLIIEKITNL